MTRALIGVCKDQHAHSFAETKAAITAKMLEVMERLEDGTLRIRTDGHTHHDTHHLTYHNTPIMTHPA